MATRWICGVSAASSSKWSPCFPYSQVTTKLTKCTRSTTSWDHQTRPSWTISRNMPPTWNSIFQLSKVLVLPNWYHMPVQKFKTWSISSWFITLIIGSLLVRPWSMHGSRNWRSKNPSWKTSMPAHWHNRVLELLSLIHFLNTVNTLMTWWAMDHNLRSAVQTSKRCQSNQTKRNRMTKLQNLLRSCLIWQMAVTMNKTRRSSALASLLTQMTSTTLNSYPWSKAATPMLKM